MTVEQKEERFWYEIFYGGKAMKDRNKKILYSGEKVQEFIDSHSKDYHIDVYLVTVNTIRKKVL